MGGSQKRLISKNGKIVFEELEVDHSKMTFAQELIQSIIVNSKRDDHALIIGAVKRYLAFPGPPVHGSVQQSFKDEIECVYDAARQMNPKEKTAFCKYLEEHFVDNEWIL